MKIELPSIADQQVMVFKAAQQEALEAMRKNSDAPVLSATLSVDESAYPRTSPGGGGCGHRAVLSARPPASHLPAGDGERWGVGGSHRDTLPVPIVRPELVSGRWIGPAPSA